MNIFEYFYFNLNSKEPVRIKKNIIESKKVTRMKKKVSTARKKTIYLSLAFVSRDLSWFSRDGARYASFDGTSEFGLRFQQTDDPIDEIYEPCCRSRRAVSSPPLFCRQTKGLVRILRIVN